MRLVVRTRCIPRSLNLSLECGLHSPIGYSGNSRHLKFVTSFEQTSGAVVYLPWHALRVVPIILTQCGLHFSLAFDFCPVGAAEHFAVTVCAGTEVGSTYGWLLRSRGYSLLIFPSTYITLTSCLGSNPNPFSYPRLQRNSVCLNRQAPNQDSHHLIMLLSWVIVITSIVTFKSTLGRSTNSLSPSTIVNVTSRDECLECPSATALSELHRSC